MTIHNTYIAPQAIHLDSRLGSHLSTLGNHVRFDLRNAIVVPQNIDCYVQMTAFRYSNVFYNVSQYNNVLYYSLSNDIGTVHEYIVPRGNYSVSSLISRLNIDLADDYMHFVYDPATFLVTVSNSEWGFILRTGSNSILLSLGIVGPTAQAITHTGIYCINLSGTSVVNVQLENLFISSNSTSGYAISLVDSVMNDVLLGSTKTISNPSASKYKINQSIITAIDVRLSGDLDRNLNMLGTPFYLSLALTFVYKFDVRMPPNLSDSFKQAGPAGQDFGTDGMANNTGPDDDAPDVNIS